MRPVFATSLLAVLFVAVAVLSLPRDKELSATNPRQISSPPTQESSVAAAATVASSTRQAQVPILVYHIVRPSYPSDDASVKAYAVTPETFDAELSHLATAGYTVIGFGELEAFLDTGAPLPPKPVILSFDDGWSDQYEYAFPILQKYHDTATFFVFTNGIGVKGYLTWDNLRTMINAGMRVGDHSKSHPYLTKIADPAKLADEIEGSKALLEEKLGVPITEFAYPFGQHNAAIITQLQAAGFKSARGDYWSGNTQSDANRYTLNALNTPTTLAQFEQRFP
jgi:peptidoglycan/xylan/chitin deacetylase (PgdA/CDA1 family)